MSGVHLSPADTCFFGDGVPFSDFGLQEDVIGVFPPHPPTVVGALRAALARARGWDGRGRWPRSLDETLGDGPNLGRLKVEGPILLRNGEPLFRGPRHLLGVDIYDERERINWNPRAMLRPGTTICCDLGDEVRLPQLYPGTVTPEDERRLKPSPWITQDGLREILKGNLPTPSNVRHDNDLWSEEPRVGLARNHDTRTAKEGALYSARHIRVRPGVTIGAQVAELPDSWDWPWGAMIPFGGESRLCELMPWNESLAVPHVLGDLAEHGRLLVVALTPLDLNLRLGGKLEFPESYGTVTLVCACVDRPQRIGGWDTRNKRSQPLGSVIPAGSVLFCESEDPQRLRQALADGPPPRLGARQTWGFGLVALGTWPNEAERNSQ